MRTLVCATVVVALVAGTANAAIFTTWAQGALRLELVYDSSGNVSMHNVAGAAYSFDAYSIWDSGTTLKPLTWRSIADWVAVDPLAASAALGVGCYPFGEATATTALLAELNQASSATLPTGNSFSIGTPFPASPPVGNYTFYYGISTAPGDKFLGLIIPEPATIGLLAIGGVALLFRRRYRR